MRRAVLFLVLLLAGCYDVVQDIWIAADGSGRFKGVYTFDADGPMFKMPTPDGKEPLVGIADKLKDVDADLRKQPGVRHVEVSADKDGDRPRLTIDVEVDDATALQATVRKAMQPKDPTGRDRTPPTGDEFSIERNDSGHLVFVKKRETKLKADAPMREMMAKTFKDHVATMRVHGPSIVSSNGTISGDTVEWTVKLAEAADAPEEMRAEVALASPLLLYGAIGGGVVVVVGGVFLLARRGSSSRPGAAAPGTGTRRRRPALGKRKEVGSGEESDEAEGES